MTRLRRLLPPLALACATATALVPVLVPGAASGAAPPPTCDGVEATHVGTPGGVVVGTEGDDVIVAAGATVDALGGDDLICLTGPLPGDPTAYAGPGDDRVIGGPRDWTVDLGTGADRFEGGSGDETVTTGDAPYDPGAVRGNDPADVLHTRAGDDSVHPTGTDVWIDDVDLGPGDDSATGGPVLADGGRLVGGSGTDDVRFYDRGTALAGRAWSIDNGPEGGTASAGGAVRMRWTGLETFELYVAGPVSFTGGDADESVEASRFATVDTGGGDDEVRLFGPRLRGDLSGGTGRDRLVLDACAGVLSLDLARGAGACVPDAPGSSTGPVRVDGFESHLLAARAVRVRGTAGRDDVAALACGGTVAGRAGDDRLRVVPLGSRDVRRCFRRSGVVTLAGQRGDDVLTGARWRDVLRGGPGADLLLGRRGDDVLVGGPGRDEVAGGPGRDRCRGEGASSCES